MLDLHVRKIETLKLAVLMLDSFESVHSFISYNGFLTYRRNVCLHLSVACGLMRVHLFGDFVRYRGINIDGLALSATSSAGLGESSVSKLCVRDRPFAQHNHWLPDNKQESLRERGHQLHGWPGLSH